MARSKGLMIPTAMSSGCANSSLGFLTNFKVIVGFFLRPSDGNDVLVRP